MFALSNRLPAFIFLMRNRKLNLACMRPDIHFFRQLHFTSSLQGAAGVMPETELARSISYFFLFILASIALATHLGNKTIKCEEAYTEFPLCRRVIAVDMTKGENCSINLLQTACSVCSNLQKVLMSLSHSNEDNSNCTEVVLTEGNYLIEADTNILINRNIYLHSNKNNIVSIELKASTSTSNSLHFKFAIQFRDSAFAIIQNVHFKGSKSGVIGFDNISQVRVINSTFR